MILVLSYHGKKRILRELIPNELEMPEATGSYQLPTGDAGGRCLGFVPTDDIHEPIDRW